MLCPFKKTVTYHYNEVKSVLLSTEEKFQECQGDKCPAYQDAVYKGNIKLSNELCKLCNGRI